MAFSPQNWIDIIYPRNNKNLEDQETLDILNEQLKEISFAYQRTDPQGRLLQSKYAGYLFASVADVTIFVPWPLARSLPSDESLKEFVRLSSLYCICCKGSICLSGSSAGQGSNIEIGDVDFCQYTESLPPSIYIQIETSIDSSSVEQKPIIVRYEDERAEAPEFERLPIVKSLMVRDSALESAKRCMIDYLAPKTLWGSLPLSNVILSCDFGDRARGAAKRSHVFQEVVFCTGIGPSAPDWTLVSVHGLRSYLEFLTTQINDYKRSKPLKALKRILSLAYTIQLFSFVEEALALLLSPDARAYICETRVIESEALKAMRDDATKQPSAPPALALDFAKRCDVLASRLLRTIEEMRS